MNLRTTIAVVIVIGVGTLALGSACTSNDLPQPTYVVEATPLSDTWTEVDALPAWVDAPPQREGYLRFVVDGKSNLRRIVTGIGGPMPRPEVADFVTERLTPVVGAAAAAAAAKVAYESKVMVERASKDEILTREMVVGGSMSTVYALWEVAIDDVLASLPEEQRADAHEALAATPARE